MGKQFINLLVVGSILFMAGKWVADLLIHHTGGIGIIGILAAAIWLAFLHAIRGRELDLMETFFVHIGHAVCAAAALWTLHLHESFIGAVIVSSTSLCWVRAKAA